MTQFMKYFTNDKFRVLKYLYDCAGKDGTTRMTQQEVADEIGLSRATINTIFKQLRTDGYLEFDEVHNSRYLLTNKAIDALEFFGQKSNPSVQR